MSRDFVVTIQVSVRVSLSDDLPLSPETVTERIARELRWYSDGRRQFSVEQIHDGAERTVRSALSHVADDYHRARLGGVPTLREHESREEYDKFWEELHRAVHESFSKSYANALDGPRVILETEPEPEGESNGVQRVE
jgi:hypothetical protein